MSRRERRNIWKRKKDGKRRDLLKERRRCEPHLGLELDGLLEKLKEAASKVPTLPDYVIMEAERLICVFISLKETNSVAGATAAVMQYVSAHLDRSMSGTVCSYLTDLFEKGMGPQGGDETPQWITMLRNVELNWQLVKQNKAFKQLSKLLGVLVTVGLCDASVLDFSLAGFKIFEKEMFEVHQSSSDIIDALIGTVTFFAEGAYLCFKKGSIRPLLVNDRQALELSEEYTEVLRLWNLCQNGNLEKFEDVTEHEFDHRLETLMASFKALLPSLKGYDKSLVTNNLNRLAIIKNDYVTLKLSAGIRKAPFALEFFGESAVGKTTLGDHVITALLTSAGLATDNEFRASVNTSEKFLSTWRTNKSVAIFDDMANEKADFVEKSPVRSVIDFCNNQTFIAPKAGVEEKGRVFVEPEL